MLDATHMGAEGDILTVRPVGTLATQEEVFGFVDLLTKQALRKGFRHVLVDGAQLSVELEPVEIVEIGNSLRNMQHKVMGLKVASTESNTIGLASIIELIAAERAIIFRSFNNKTAAVEWLLET